MAATPIFSNTPQSTAITVASAGYRTFISNDMALRAALGLVIGSSSTPANGLTDFKVSNTGLQIGVGIMKFMQANAELAGYFGGQLTYLMGTSKNTPSHNPGNTDDFQSNSGSALGIGVMVGGEWFFNTAMSLGAEYQFGFSSTSATRTNNTGGQETKTDGESSTYIGTQTATVTLNVYLSR